MIKYFKQKFIWGSNWTIFIVKIIICVIFVHKAFQIILQKKSKSVRSGHLTVFSTYFFFLFVSQGKLYSLQLQHNVDESHSSFWNHSLLPEKFLHYYIFNNNFAQKMLSRKNCGQLCMPECWFFEKTTYV